MTHGPRIPVDRTVLLDVIGLLTLVVEAGEDDHAAPSQVLELAADAADLRAQLRDAIAEAD